MSSFSDTFTKNQEQEELLNYDDSAAYYFGATVLLCILIPWTWVWIRHIVWGATAGSFPKKTFKFESTIRYCRNSLTEKNIQRIEDVDRKKEQKNKLWIRAKFCGLVFLWVLWAYCVFQLADDSLGGSIQAFNPFEILDIESPADDKKIKQAYRRASLIWHPDKNPGDPLASAKFIQITRAYRALTDPVAKDNYEKYGNPDGQQTTKVGIGLPRFLLEKKNHLLILCIFFAAFLIVIPAFFITYYQKQKGYAANGVLVETLQFLGHYISETTKMKNCVELLAASGESRDMELRLEDDKEMKPIIELVVEHQKRKFQMPVIVRNNYLLWAHLQRLHHLMTPELRMELDELLRHADKITNSMIEIACVREWYATAQAVIEFRRALVQALDVKASTLLQIPHFNDETIKHCYRGNNAIKEVQQFLDRDPTQRRGVANMGDEELLDLEEFTKHVTQIDVQCKAEVEGEKTICKEDIATVTVKITRTNLEEGEALGYVHAPLFPELKQEEWYIFLTENSKIICYERVRTQERVITERLRFHVGRKGKHNLQIVCMCDAYAGIDKTCKVEFDAILPEDDTERSIYVHPEDEKLDLHPTLFQQLVGELNPNDESEDEEDVNKKAPTEKAADNGGGSDSDSSSSSSDGSSSEAE